MGICYLLLFFRVVVVMQLNRLIINPRVRQPWAAIDLGVLSLAKKHWRHYLAGLSLHYFYTPLMLLFYDSVWLILIVWWFKPVFERTDVARHESSFIFRAHVFTTHINGY